MVLSHLFFAHAYSHLTNVCICHSTGYLSVMINCDVVILWWPFPMREIFRLIVPDSNYIWPCRKISCQMLVFSTKSIWKEGKGLGHTLKTWKHFTKILPSFLFYKCVCHWSSKKCLIRGGQCSWISVGRHLSHWWMNFWSAEKLTVGNDMSAGKSDQSIL